MLRALHLNIKPRLHPIPDTCPFIILFSFRVCHIKHPGVIHIQPGFVHNVQGLVMTGLQQVQVVDAGQGIAVHADGGHGRQIPQLCKAGKNVLQRNILK